MVDDTEKEALKLEDFVFLNESKLDAALIAAGGDKASVMGVLAAYDKLGGAIKKSGRKLAMGTFYDFENKKPRENVNLEKLGDDAYEDEYVLVRKKAKLASAADHLQIVKQRLARVSRESLAPVGKAAAKAKEKEKESEE